MASQHALLLSLLGLTLSGCSSVASLQDFQYSHTNKKRAAEYWRNCYSSEQRKCLSCDYEAGFKTGFFDTATGVDCKPPAVPPPKYWAAKYQCCEGQEAIQDWYKGYQCGIVAAQSKGFPSFHEVPVGIDAPTLNKTACGMCASCDPCECSVGNDAPYEYSAPAAVEPIQIQESIAPPYDIPPPQIGMIGGFGAPKQINLIGPIDSQVIMASGG